MKMKGLGKREENTIEAKRDWNDFLRKRVIQGMFTYPSPSAMMMVVVDKI